MFDRLIHFFSSLGSDLTWTQVMLGALISIVTFAASIALVVFFLVWLPPTYFHPAHNREFMNRHYQAVRWFGLVVKNLIGAIVVILGMIMALPGVPGQGLMTILVGLTLVDFPGKRKLEYKIISRPSVLRAVNRLRRKFSKPPLVL